MGKIKTKSLVNIKYPFPLLNCSKLSLSKYLFFFYLGGPHQARASSKLYPEEGDNCPLDTQAYTGLTNCSKPLLVSSYKQPKSERSREWLEAAAHFLELTPGPSQTMYLIYKGNGDGRQGK